ncbi:hypothetical protein [Paenibacillus sp. y28]|uniref:hypothetical protein n=1 Tax=Paenibacillus sp. y28 TaxID=3129110 RepID=UPI003017AA62
MYPFHSPPGKRATGSRPAQRRLTSPSRSGVSPAASLIQLQQTLGNRVVSQLLKQQKTLVQAKTDHSSPVAQRVIDWTTIGDRDPEEFSASISQTTGGEDYMVGFGEDELTGGTRWRTQVTWGPQVTPKISKSPGQIPKPEGTRMVAFPLGPDHPQGSEPVDNTRTNSQIMTQNTGVQWIAGHLLNDNLGGPGDDSRNIAAIPSKPTNGLHSSQVEEKVKEQVNDLGRWVYYEVDASDRDTNNIAKTIKTKWYLLDKDMNRTGPEHIHSIPVPQDGTTHYTIDDTGATDVGTGVQEAFSFIGMSHPYRVPFLSDKTNVKGKEPTGYPYNPFQIPQTMEEEIEPAFLQGHVEDEFYTDSQQAFIKEEEALEYQDSKRKGRVLTLNPNKIKKYKGSHNFKEVKAEAKKRRVKKILDEVKKGNPGKTYDMLMKKRILEALNNGPDDHTARAYLEDLKQIEVRRGITITVPAAYQAIYAAL